MGVRLREATVLQTEDLFLGAFGLVRGGELRDVEVRGLNGKRMAVFVIEGPGMAEVEREYHRGPSARGPASSQVRGRTPEEPGIRGAPQGGEKRCRSRRKGSRRIKAANPLADVVAERGITLKKKGRALVAPCPFHEEKTPSFTVTPSKGLFHCFGCGVAGDVIGFVTKPRQGELRGRPRDAGAPSAASISRS